MLTVMETRNGWSSVVRRVAADFDRLADRYDATHAANSTFWPPLFKALPDPCRSVLELGCGGGELLVPLARRCARVTGVDVSERMLDHARKRTQDLPNVRLALHDIEDLASFEPGVQYDAVVSVNTLHHCDLPATLAGIRGRVAPGGVAYIMDVPSDRPTPPRRSPYLEAIRHDLRHPWQGLRTVFELGPLALLGAYRSTRDMFRDDAWLKHQMHDVADGRGYTLAVFERELTTWLPGGALRVFCGLAFSYHWCAPTQEGPHARQLQ